jgi:hypothetical protein
MVPNTELSPRDLTPAFGAEVVGFDADRDLTGEGADRIRSLLDERGVVLFRAAHLTRESHEDLVRLLSGEERFSDEYAEYGAVADIYVWGCHRAGGYLCRQGPATPRWVLFEFGKSAARPGSPYYEYYQQVKKPTTASSLPLPCPQTGPPLLPHPAQPRPRGGLRHARRLSGTNPVGIRGPDSPHQTSGSPRSAPATRMPASTRTRRPYNTDATALPDGGGDGVEGVT